MHNPTVDELRAAQRPLVSLLSKSEKAQQKLAPGTWQHTMVNDTIAALRTTLALLHNDPLDTQRVSQADLDAALPALAAIIVRVEKALAMFAPGTSQHTLQTNRLRALQIGEALVNVELRKRNAAPDAAS